MIPAAGAAGASRWLWAATGVRSEQQVQLKRTLLQRARAFGKDRVWQAPQEGARILQRMELQAGGCMYCAAEAGGMAEHGKGVAVISQTPNHHKASSTQKIHLQ